ncbi:MAG: GGDEF domain-containing protein [Clostridiales bacterium]|nr:GGDEF domain-containing protein [Clostridiales bacterium]
MARKKIGLFMSEITQYYQESCGKKIIELAKQRDMDVIVYASYGSYSCPYGRNLLSEMGKKNIIYLPDYSQFDAIIALPNTFDIYGMDTEFYNLVRKNASCPVICLQSGETDFYSISIENRETMYRMTKHFIDDHKFTKICYMSGPFKSKDSPDRLLGFKQAMEEAGLEVRDNTIYEGNYWINRGVRAMDHFLNGTDDYPEAIICANDYMALSICDELKRRGKRVPEDVCVCGFDGIREGEHNDPSLTTVTIKPEDYAKAAFEIIDMAYEGKTPPKRKTLSDKIRLRKSCGCGKQYHPKDGMDHVKQQLESEYLLREAGRISGDYQNNYDLDNSLYVADYYYHTLGCDTGYLCLCDENDPAFRSVEQNRVFSDDMILKQIMGIVDSRLADTAGVKFDRSKILPDTVFDSETPQAYIIFPIFFKNKEYGYIVLNPSEGQWPNSLMNTYINSLSAAIENSYYQSQFIELAEIKRLSETDPLTGLYNRRGFENMLQNTLASFSAGMTISIASIDMDNLKLINDIYGHADGDFALKTLSEVLKSSLEPEEFCARFGGDEFSAVIITREPGRVDRFIDIFTSHLSEASRSSGKPYPIHASIGVCDLNGGDTKHIFACMQTADERMYINKRNYKKAQR